jgi:hypothetical protein
MTTENIPLIAECERAGIRLSVAGDKLVVEAPAGVVKPELLDRLRQHKAALVEALASEANATAPASDLPPGWPADVAAPDWWPEFCSIKGNIEVLAARRSDCQQCGFGVAIQWQAPGMAKPLWSCPRCTSTSPDSMEDAIQLATTAQKRPVPVWCLRYAINEDW